MRGISEVGNMMNHDQGAPRELDPVGTREFVCKGCGATLVYHAGAKKLKCEYCGAEQELEAASVVAVEHTLAELAGKQAATGFGLESKSFKCQNCGATTSCPSNVTSTKCAFCGSPQVLDTPPNPNLLRPETMVPFQLDKKTAVDKFRGWIKGLWFRPNDLKKISRLSDIEGIYTPFWTFDCNARSDWTADAGYYYYETEEYTDYEDGKPVRKSREVQKVRWEPAWGSHSAFYDDELVCASKGLSLELMNRIYPFNLSALTPYQPEFLSGWLAEEYDIDPTSGWELGKASINDQERSACAAEVPGDTHRNLNVSTTYSDITWKHVLLPVWLAAYRYREKTYRFLVNGQTGEVQGEAPISWWKVGFAVLCGLAVVAAIWYFKQGR